MRKYNQYWADLNREGSYHHQPPAISILIIPLLAHWWRHIGVFLIQTFRLLGDEIFVSPASSLQYRIYCCQPWWWLLSAKRLMPHINWYQVTDGWEVLDVVFSGQLPVISWFISIFRQVCANRNDRSRQACRPRYCKNLAFDGFCIL